LLLQRKHLRKTLSRGTLRVSWDSVKVFDGVRISFQYFPYKNFLTKGKHTQLTSLSATIDPNDYLKLKHFFEKYLPDGSFKYHDDSNGAGYNLKYCSVRIWKSGKSKESSNQLEIQVNHRKKPTKH
jgi:hypothetical protein